MFNQTLFPTILIIALGTTVLPDAFASESTPIAPVEEAGAPPFQPETVARLSGTSPARVKAYNLYLESVNLEKTEIESEALMIQRRDLLEEAVRIDPSLVEAWALMSRHYALMRNRLGRGWFLGNGLDPEEVRRGLNEKSEQSLARAVSLNPNNVETLLSLAVDHRGRAELPTDVRIDRRRILQQVIREYPANAAGWYYLGWWFNQGWDREETIISFEEALKRDPFNIRYVDRLLFFYRNWGYPEDVTRLYKRLVQLKPELVEDQQLATISVPGRIRQIETAFIDSANEDLLARLESTWSEWNPSGRENDNQFVKDWWEEPVRELSNEKDRIIEIADETYSSGRSSSFEIRRCIDLNDLALSTLVIEGRIEQSKEIARRIIEVAGQLPSQVSTNIPFVQSSLAQAHAVLGETEKARVYADRVVKQRSETFDRDGRYGIVAVSRVDRDRAADMVIKEIADDPDWQGLDWMAAYHLLAREVLVQPRVQAYILESGKWTEYLSSRIPGYATEGGG